MKSASVKTVTEVTLTLTTEEAAVLLELSHRVGGDARYTPRKVWDDLREALREAGVEAAKSKFSNQCGSIYYE